jgi:hypothetical protein
MLLVRLKYGGKMAEVNLILPFCGSGRGYDFNHAPGFPKVSSLEILSPVQLINFVRWRKKMTEKIEVNLKQHFEFARLKSDYLINLVKRVIFRIIEITGNDEIVFGRIWEEPTFSGEDAEVNQHDNIVLDSRRLKKYDDEVSMALIAHEFAHYHKEHHKSRPDGLEFEDEADQLAREWGFNVDQFREVLGPPTTTKYVIPKRNC